ncbi:MAG: glycosyltransferase involved in cell wall biosynthesis [Bacteriovoracaceae bacterium]|jgi:glycosyltransferase involved in cell wall biosynthesis
MKISIVTPTFNSEKTIERTIRSILNQNLFDLEIILVDNESSDETVSIAQNLMEGRSEKLLTIVEKDSGISDAFSKGVLASSSEVVGILNSDDEYFNSKVLNRVMKAFEDPNVDFVHGDMLFIDDKHGTNIRKPLMCSLKYAMPINHPTFFLRKKVYNEIGVFKLDYRFAMDFELMCRMYRDAETCKYKGFYLSGDPIVSMYAGGVSWTHELKSIDEVEKALKAYGFWDAEAKKHQDNRRRRIKIKNFLMRLRLDPLVKVWRRLKWNNNGKQ